MFVALTGDPFFQRLIGAPMPTPATSTSSESSIYLPNIKKMGTKMKSLAQPINTKEQLFSLLLSLRKEKKSTKNKKRKEKG